jgi:nucleotide-binding universal stress UspA family protein
MWQKLTNIHRVLVPVDLTDDSLCAVEAALTYSKERKTQIYLIHVISPHEETDKKSLAMEEFFLKKIKPQSNIACIVRAGTPAREILRFAGEEGIDLIVLPLGPSSHSGRPGPGGIADIIIKNATVPVVVVKPESAARQARGFSGAPGNHPANHMEGKNIMKYDEKYLQEIRQRVCSKCIDRTASGLCTASTFDACAINRYLPEIIDIVMTGQADDYDATVDRLRSRVCSACEQQSPDGRCDMRDDVECALDRYFPLVIEAIRDAARK